MVGRLALVVGLGFRADGRGAAAFGLLTATEALLQPLVGLWLKLLLEAVLVGDPGRLLAALAGLLASQAAAEGAGWVGLSLRFTLYERVQLWLGTRLASLVAGLPGLAHLESPEWLDRLEVLNRQRSALAQAPVNALLLAGAALSLPVFIGLLLAAYPPAALLPLLGVAALMAEQRAEKLRELAMMRSAQGARVADWFFHLALDPGAGAELRVFGAGPAVLARYRQLRAEVTRLLEGTLLPSGLLVGAGWLVFTAGFFGLMLGAIAWGAAVGDLLLILTLGWQAGMLAAGLVRWGASLFPALGAADLYLRLEREARQAGGAVREPVPVPRRLREGIELCRVSFSYPSGGRPALEGLDLKLPAGRVAAIVGENGVGKTTLVKLLCGFYAPQAGRILVDGVELGRFDPQAWRRRVTGVFQDFCRFEFSLRESVGVGDLARMGEPAAVLAAMRRAGIGHLPAELPAGLETILGSRWERGVELSEGQWQGVALARAMMRLRPLLVVLDEPTGSLDPETEQAVFDRCVAAARRTARRTGTVVLVISHRLGVGRLADLVVVLAGGRVVEAGSHAELLQRGGLYADLYRIQAKIYR